MSVVRRSAPLVVLSLAALPLAAQPEGGGSREDPRLASLVAEALARNPDLLEAEEAVAAARTRPGQARALDDPTLSWSYTNDGWAPTLGDREMTNLGVMVGQLLPWPGKRRLRGEVAGFEAEEVEAGRERVRRGVVAAVKRAYFSLVLARQLLALTAEQEEVWKQIEGVARARYGVGQGAQQDVLRVQVELTRTHQQRAELDGEARIRSAELHRLLGRSPGPPLETATGLELVREPARPREEALVRAEEASPELQGAAAATQRAVRLAELARKDSWPDLGIQAGYMNRGGLDSMWQAGLSANLPLRGGRRAAARAEADARVRASERRREALRLQLRFRTEERLAQLETAETLARLYGEGIVPQDQMSVEAAVANYQAGKVPFVAVLEALNSLYADRATYLRVVAGQHVVRASIEEASLDATSALPAGSGMSGRGAAVSAGNASGASPMTGMGK